MEQREKLTLSGLQHFAFCRRQWALIFVEQQWQENYLTAAGSVMHQRAHDATQTESFSLNNGLSFKYNCATDK